MPIDSLKESVKYQGFFGFLDEGLICAFSKRQDGNMSFIYGNSQDSIDNRKNFLERLSINYQDLVCAKQVHKTKVSYVKEEDKGKGALSYDTALADTDALITDRKQVPLAIFTADCLSIFLYAPKREIIGLIHAGWRGTQKNITTQTIDFLTKQFKVEPQQLYIGFGPAIRKCCYEVDAHFQNLFDKGLIQKDGRYFLDLVGLNKEELLDLGVKKENIFDCEICTFCQNKDFFSYRREGKACGRIISVIMLK